MNIDLKKFFTEFLNSKEVNTIEKAQKSLITNRNTKFINYSLAESRILHMAVLLYKFKDEMETGEVMWHTVRNMILSVLRNDDCQFNLIRKYLTDFPNWRDNDLDRLVLEISGIYYNIIETRKSIDNNSEQTKQEWLPHIDLFTKRIIDSCNKLNIYEKVVKNIAYIENQKSEVVYAVLSKAYWDSIQHDLSNDNYELLYRNMDELRMNLQSIIPKKDTSTLAFFNEFFDLDYIKGLVNRRLFNKDYLVILFNYLANLLKDMDSIEFRDIYQNEIDATLTLVNDSDMPRSIRVVMERICILTENLRNRKAIWEKLLSDKN
jgi:hypothetical protein